MSPRRPVSPSDRASLFDAADRESLARRGIALDEALRQIELLLGPPRHRDLVRPCTRGDGIDVLSASEAEEALARHARAAASGRVCAMIPASGAATRMFASLATCRSRAGDVDRPTLERERAEGARDAAEALAFLDGLDRLPFGTELCGALAARGEDLGRLVRDGRMRPILEALLGQDGLALAARPKGLLPFHAYPDGSRTALEELLVEAAAARDAAGVCRLHLTVAEEHRAGFIAALERVRGRYQDRLGVRLDVGFSVQRAETDTLAADGGCPARRDDGSLLFRPAGHGALLLNLRDLGGDLVFVKNVDNVVPDGRKEAGLRWSRLLVGHLAGVQERAFRILDRLDDPDDAAALGEARAFARDALHLDLAGAPGDAGEARGFLRDLIDRPLRVCGMVVDTGEPGGGPFWCRDRERGTSLQIVEGAEVAPEQRGLVARATHFNPVFMACAPRDRRGRPFDLLRFQDPEAVILTGKAWQGRTIVALERPGLWNGSMARWNTIFVEVPAEVFSPVKTVVDLLRPEHQPPPG